MILNLFFFNPQGDYRFSWRHPQAPEKEIFSLKYYVDLTVFIVSQRAASLQHADQIIVLDDGHMVGLGRHAELLESCPVYKEIYESQFKKGDAQK